MELQDFIEKVKEQFEEEYEVFDANTRFRELDEWTSLTSLSIIAMIDDEYDVIIKADDIKSVDTVGELFELIKTKA